jgi:hypothetical protein
MKKTFIIKHEEEVEIDFQFPMYLQPNEYTCVAILDEEQMLKCSVYEKWRASTEQELQHSVYISCAPDKYEVNKLLEEFFSGKSKEITPEEFDAFYFNARKLVSIQFNKLDNNALPE